VDELERLIKQQRRPSPRPSLDERIASVLCAVPQPAQQQPHKRSRLLALCSVAACTGLVGFVFGRMTVPTEHPESDQRKVAGQSEAITHSVLKLPLASEQVADFAVRLPPTEGIWGAIPRNK
jgi:hypothetical protein